MSDQCNLWQRTVLDIYHMILLHEAPMSALERNIFRLIRARHHEAFGAEADKADHIG